MKAAGNLITLADEQQPSMDTLAWHLHSLGEAVELLALKANIGARAAERTLPSFPENLLSEPILTRWMDLVASALAIECEPVNATYAECQEFLSKAAPAILRLPAVRSDFSQEPLATTRFIVLLAKRGDSVWLLGQDAKRYRLRIASLSAQLCQSFEAAFANYTNCSIWQAAILPPRPKNNCRPA